MERIEARGPDAWARTCSETYVSLTASAHADFRGRIHRADVGGVGLSRARHSASTIARSARLISSDPRDDVLLSMIVSGEGIIDSRGDQRRIRSGSAVFCEADVPYIMRFDSDALVVTVQVPRARMPIRDDALRSTHGAVIPARSVSILRHFVTSVLKSGDLAADQGSDAADLTISLLTQALIPGMMAFRHPERCSVGAALLDAAVAILERSYHDADLTIDAVAARCGVSRRRLDEEFASSGSSPAEYLRRTRLEQARRLIAADELLRIADVALMVGFNDPTTFTRAFTRTFGATPFRFRKSIES